MNAERKQHFETAKAYYRLVDGSLYTVSRRSLISIYTQQNKPNDALRFLTQERVNYPQHASFLFAEGLADCYQQAEYAEFKVDEQGNAILTALKGDQLQDLGCESKRDWLSGFRATQN